MAVAEGLFLVLHMLICPLLPVHLCVLNNACDFQGLGKCLNVGTLFGFLLLLQPLLFLLLLLPLLLLLRPFPALLTGRSAPIGLLLRLLLPPLSSSSFSFSMQIKIKVDGWLYLSFLFFVFFN